MFDGHRNRQDLNCVFNRYERAARLKVVSAIEIFRMPIFTPIDSGISMKTSLSTLERLVLDGDALEADFLIPEDATKRLRVTFPRVEITRTLDEMPLSTEEQEKWVGLKAEHLAYEVEDAHFWRSQSSALKIAIKDLKHYVFITGWTCLDVISKHPPTFSIVNAPAARDPDLATQLGQKQTR